MDKMKLMLSAAIINAEKEIDIYNWLSLTAPEYGAKSYDKRFETWLNKQSIEQFGMYTMDNWGMNSESKDFPNVNFSVRKNQYTDVREVSFSYKGKDIQYDYDTKTYEMREHHEYETIYDSKDIASIVERCKGLVVSRNDAVLKMKNNLGSIALLIKEHDDIKHRIEVFNDKISYVLSGELRIKR